MQTLIKKITSKNLDWTNSLFLIIAPVASVLLITLYIKVDGFDPMILIPTLVFYFLTGLGITAGYHRLFAHRSYKANRLIKGILLFFGAGAFQNSALKWSTDHRRHHGHCDKEKDPYSVKKGFWWSHMGWVMVKEEEQYKNKYAKDLANDPLVWFQHKYCFPIALLSGFILPTMIGFFMGSALGGFAIIALARIVFVHHCTFFINSLAHMWGSQPYTDQNSAKDNFVLALFTYGEGYHNFHHYFQNDYRNGVKWYQYDPTKWLIKSCEFIGWTENLKLTSEEEILTAKMRMKEKSLEKVGVNLSHLDQVKATVENAFKNLQALRRQLQVSYSIELEIRIKEELKIFKANFNRWSQKIETLAFTA